MPSSARKDNGKDGILVANPTFYLAVPPRVIELPLLFPSGSRKCFLYWSLNPGPFTCQAEFYIPSITCSVKCQQLVFQFPSEESDLSREDLRLLTYCFFSPLFLHNEISGGYPLWGLPGIFRSFQSVGKQSRRVQGEASACLVGQTGDSGQQLFSIESFLFNF